MHVKTKAIVLNSLKYGESQIIVDMLTESVGRVSFMQRIPRSSRSGISKQLFQPLTILDVEFDYRQSQKLQRLKNAAIAWPFCSIPFDAHKLGIALFMAEFVTYATRSEQQNRDQFMFVENSVMWLDTCVNSFANFHIVFMLHMTRFVGFFPNMDGRQDCHYFDLRGGCFTPYAPVHGDFLKPDEAGKIQLLMRLNYTTMRLLSLTRNERNRIVDVILYYYRLHLPDFPDMKSLPVLKELFC